MDSTPHSFEIYRENHEIFKSRVKSTPQNSRKVGRKRSNLTRIIEKLGSEGLRRAESSSRHVKFKAGNEIRTRSYDHTTGDGTLEGQRHRLSPLKKARMRNKIAKCQKKVFKRRSFLRKNEKMRLSEIHNMVKKRLETIWKKEARDKKRKIRNEIYFKFSTKRVKIGLGGKFDKNHLKFLKNKKCLDSMNASNSFNSTLNKLERCVGIALNSKLLERENHGYEYLKDRILTKRNRDRVIKSRKDNGE